MSTHFLRAGFLSVAVCTATVFACGDDPVDLGSTLDGGSFDAALAPDGEAAPPTSEAGSDSAAPEIGAPMVLDPAFDATGKTIVIGSSGAGAIPVGLVLESNSSLVAAVLPASADGKSQANLFRFGADGKPDTLNFAGGAGGAPTGVTYAQLAISPATDQLYVFGSPPDAPGSARIARFTSAGAVDTTFGTNGDADLGSGGGIPLVLPNGKAVNGLGGGANITRYDSTGKLDTTFGGGTGVSTQTITRYEFRAIAANTDGSMYVGGNVLDADMKGTCALVHIDNAGVLDAAFGEALIDKDCSAVRAVFITAAGVVVHYQDKSNTFGMVRLSVGGALDAGFKKQTEIASPTADVVKLNDDSFIALSVGTTDRSLSVWQIGSDGAVSPPRHVTEKWGPNNFMLIQPDGKLVIFGRIGDELIVARYQL